MKTVKITMLLVFMWSMTVAQIDQKQPEEVPISKLKEFPGIVFPNPTEGFVTVRIDGKIKGVVTLAVYDMLGATVLMEKDTFFGKGYEKQLDLNELPNGYYIITVRSKRVSFVENIEVVTD